MEPQRHPGVRQVIDLRAAVLAGIASAVAATIAEILLWWMNGIAVCEMLFRDARLAAAIVMGPGVIIPTSTFDWHVMLVATCLHFSLSILYAAVLAAAIRHAGSMAATAAGSLFGLLLYIVNMYGFTRYFPWFIVTRDWITAIAHVVFGAAAGTVYAAVLARSVARRR